MDWEHIRVKHVVSTDNSGQYGFLAAAPIGLPVPAVIPALCAAGFRRLLKDRKDNLIKHCRGETDHGSPCKFPEGMPDLMKHLLADHIDAEYWQQCWSNCVASDAKRARKRKAKPKKDDGDSSSDSSSSESDSDGEMAWLEGLALDEIND